MITQEPKLRWKVLLEYRSIFPDNPAESINYYLNGIDKAMLRKTAAYFLGFKSQGSKYDDLNYFFSHFFQLSNANWATSCYRKIREFESDSQKEVIIMNPYSSLLLFELIHNIPDTGEVKDSAQFERDIFIAYLLINQKQVEGELIASKSTSHLEFKLKWSMITMCHLFPIFDITNYTLTNLWITQTIKAISLFRFLEENVRTRLILNNFLSHFQCNSWQDYLKKYIPLTISVMKADKEAHIDISLEGENINDSAEFIDRLILLNDTTLDEADFKTLRANPIYKFEKGRYTVIFGLFVIEKLFKGLYFMLNHFNEQLPIDDRIRNFRSEYCDSFSEKTLFNGIIKSIFNGKSLNLSGEEMLAQGIEAEPDYYVRRGKSLFLFESKDILFNASVKRSRDFKVLEAEIKKKLYYVEDSGKRKPKAILQLINNIKRVLTRDFEFDQGYNRKVEIYPVLVLHDHFFNIPGLNTLLNTWFDQEIQNLRQEGFLIKRVKPLVIITIDFLVQFQDAFRDDINEFRNAIEEFYQKTSAIPLERKKFRTQKELENIMNNISLPFDLVGYNYFSDKGAIKVPEMLKDYGYSLFVE